MKSEHWIGPDPYAVIDTTLYLEGPIWCDVETVEAGPWYTVGEASKFFFARSSHWMRRCERQIEVDRVRGSRRRYNLADIERIAFALAQRRLIDGRRFMLVLLLVKLEAQLHGHKYGRLKYGHSG